MIAAQYPGACSECEHPIKPDQMIESDGEGWRHVKCPPGPVRRPPCDRCGLEHPGEC